MALLGIKIKWKLMSRLFGCEICGLSLAMDTGMMTFRKLMKEFKLPSCWFIWVKALISSVQNQHLQMAGICGYLMIFIGIEPKKKPCLNQTETLWPRQPRSFWIPGGESRSREHCGFSSPEVGQMVFFGPWWKCLHHFHGPTSPFSPWKGIDGIWMGYRMVPSWTLS